MIIPELQGITHILRDPRAVEVYRALGGTPEFLRRTGFRCRRAFHLPEP